MISRQLNSSEELDVTVNSNVSELEKTLLQVKSLRYQMYTKYLSEKLSYEKKLRQLENEINSSMISLKENSMEFPLNGTSSSRKPLAQRNQNLTSISTQTHPEKAIQTCNFDIPHLPVVGLDEITGKGVRNNKAGQQKPQYDERLFSIVEQLEHLNVFEY